MKVNVKGGEWWYVHRTLREAGVPASELAKMARSQEFFTRKRLERVRAVKAASNAAQQRLADQQAERVAKREAMEAECEAIRRARKAGAHKVKNLVEWEKEQAARDRAREAEHDRAREAEREADRAARRCMLARHMSAEELNEMFGN